MREPTVEDAVACNLTQVGGTQLPHLQHSLALTFGWTAIGLEAVLNCMWVARQACPPLFMLTVLEAMSNQ